GPKLSRASHEQPQAEDGDDRPAGDADPGAGAGLVDGFDHVAADRLRNDPPAWIAQPGKGDRAQPGQDQAHSRTSRVSGHAVASAKGLRLLELDLMRLIAQVD